VEDLDKKGNNQIQKMKMIIRCRIIHSLHPCNKKLKKETAASQTAVNLKGRNNLENLDMDGQYIKLDLKKESGWQWQ
jgi:hypothetical protein